MAIAERTQVVDGTGPYVARNGGLFVIVRVEDGRAFADDHDDFWDWQAQGGTFLCDASPEDLIAKADVFTLSEAFIRNLRTIGGARAAAIERHLDKLIALFRESDQDTDKRLADLADDSDPELAARHAGAENGGDEEEPKAVIDGVKLEPGEWVCRNEKIVRVHRWGESERERNGRRRRPPGAEFVAEWGENPALNWDPYLPNGQVACTPHSGNESADIVRKHEPKVEPPKGDVITGPLKVELKKGFVGITADGRKATVFCQCIGCEPGSAFNVMLPGDSREESRSYYANGTPVNPGSPRIVAPYPPEKPFDGAAMGELFYALDTRDGSIVKAKLVNVADDQYRLAGPVEAEWRYWFVENGKGYSRAEHLRVLGPVEPHVEPKPEPQQEPKLEEPLSEGEWCAVDADNARIKVSVYKTWKDGGAEWFFAIDERSADDPWRGFVETDGTCYGGDLQLIRRHRESTVEPYTSDEDKGRMFGKTVKRKANGAEYKITDIHDYGARLHNTMTGADGSESWKSLANEFTRSDGSPCGNVTVDPWDA